MSCCGGSSSDSVAASSKRKADQTTEDCDSAASKRPQHASGLVFCVSGIYGAEVEALETACNRLNARLVTEWSSSVTHLVMQKISWSPKFLHALASLVPVVSPKWLEAAASTPEGHPLPSPSEPELAVRSMGPSTDGVANVKPGRANLFRNRRYICLPGDDLADTAALLRKMGAEVSPWPTPEGRKGAEASAYVAAMAAEGWHFLHPSEEKWPSSAEAKAAVAAGADVISPLLVRTSLILAKRASVMQVQAQASAAREKMRLVTSGEH